MSNMTQFMNQLGQFGQDVTLVRGHIFKLTFLSHQAYHPMRLDETNTITPFFCHQYVKVIRKRKGKNIHR